jgi:alpha-mannosidase
VKLDDEQLPYASRHYITAQRFIRIGDASSEMTVACPDAPLWQVGGYTFGRFGDPDGRVTRERPTLVAWLTNNYWSTNFQADQGGQTKYRFTLVPSPRRELGASAQAALSYAQPLATHVFAERGPVRGTAASLLQLDLGTALLTRLEADGDGVALTVLNPGDAEVRAKVGAVSFKPTKASRTPLSGGAGEALPVNGGAVSFTIAPRTWTRIALS